MTRYDTRWIAVFLAIVAVCSSILAVRVPADEVRCYESFCARVVSGVVHVPTSVYHRLSRAQRAAARLHAARNGIRWVLVRDR